MNRIRLFFRWLYNARGKEVSGENTLSFEWETPAFVKLKERKLNVLVHIWRQSYGIVMKFFLLSSMNLIFATRLALTLFWDLGARNHEVTLLKVKHIRPRERYGEGEIPHEAIFSK